MRIPGRTGSERPGSRRPSAAATTSPASVVVGSVEVVMTVIPSNEGATRGEDRSPDPKTSRKLEVKREVRRPTVGPLRGGPRDGGWVDARAPRAAAAAGEVDGGGEAAGGLGRRDERRVDAVEHQLGAAEHLELAIRVDLAPREVQEAVAALAVHRGPAEVEAVV